MKKISLLVFVFCMFIACGDVAVKEDVEIDKTEEETKETKETKERVDIELTKAEREMVNYNNEFAFEFFKKVHEVEKGEGNTFVSPLSLTLAFSMLNNGAAGETQKEIEETLGFAAYTTEEINDFYQKLMEASAEIDPLVTVETANSIWAHTGFPILQPFIDVNKKYYKAEIRNEDFALPATVDKINQWVSDKTHEKITDIIKELDPDARVALINALYFLGQWDLPFDKNNTQKEAFTNYDGTKTEVDMMNKVLEKAMYDNYGDYEALSLPYGNGAFYMQVVLPKKGKTISDILASVDKRDFVHPNGPVSVREVFLKLPKFKSEYEIDLNEIMYDLGIKKAFGDADFSLLSNSQLAIGLVKQKAIIEVDEAGSEAAAATTIVMVQTSEFGDETPTGPVKFHVDRPFLYMIREFSTGTIFFMGEVNEF
ncbi:serpin family protein [Parabacteroides sp. OttesenSCG-928-O15]|nr:serpin family protein [Parabacteroides sp. OttesenSCG-928-O15]